MNERVNVQTGMTYFSTAADLSGFPHAEPWRRLVQSGHVQSRSPRTSDPVSLRGFKVPVMKTRKSWAFADSVVRLRRRVA